MATATATATRATKTKTTKTEAAPEPAVEVDYAGAALALKLLSDETRVRVLCTLAEGERYVGDLCDFLGHSQPALSHHLALLRVAGFVEGRREGKNVFYYLSDRGYAALLAIHAVAESA